MMKDNWDFYSLLVEDKPASIFVNLAWRAKAPKRSYDQMGFIRVYMNAPRDDGLSSQEEFETLKALEDAVTGLVCRKSPTVYVGRNTADGSRDLFFYTKNGRRFEEAARKAMSAFPAYKYECGCREDKNWEVYLDFLYPAPWNMQRIQNRHVCETLENQGDDLAATRAIDHHVYLPSPAAVDAFRAFLDENGYSIIKADEAPGEGGLYWINFSRDDKPAEIDETLWPVFEMTTKLGGDYDGWGCHVTGGAK